MVVMAPPNTSHHAGVVNPEKITGGGAISNAAASMKNTRLVIGSARNPVAQAAMQQATRMPARTKIGEPSNSHGASPSSGMIAAIVARRRISDGAGGDASIRHIGPSLRRATPGHPRALYRSVSSHGIRVGTQSPLAKWLVRDDVAA